MIFVFVEFRYNLNMYRMTDFEKCPTLVEIWYTCKLYRNSTKKQSAVWNWYALTFIWFLNFVTGSFKGRCTRFEGIQRVWYTRDRDEIRYQILTNPFSSPTFLLLLRIWSGETVVCVQRFWDIAWFLLFYLNLHEISTF